MKPLYARILVELLNLILKDEIMKRRMFLLGRGGCLVLISALIIVFGAANTYALPLNNVEVTYGGTSFGGWATVYTFNADEIDGPYAAFCVDPASLNTSYGYELISVPRST